MTDTLPVDRPPLQYSPSSGGDRGPYLNTLLDSFETLTSCDACVLLRAAEGVFEVEAGRGKDIPGLGFRVAIADMPAPGMHRSVVSPWPHASIQSWLFVSIRARERWVEWVALGRRGKGAFSARECMEASAVARLAGHVFGNEALQMDMAEQLNRFSILIKIGQVLSSNLDLDLLLDSVYREVSRFFDTTNFYIALCRPQSMEFELAIAIEHGQRESEHAIYPMGNGLTGYVIRSAKPLFLPVYATQHDFLEREGIVAIGELPKSWMGVPLITGDMVVGVMAIQSYETEGVYTQADLELFSAIASQIAVAVRNAQLYEDAERRARETSVIAAIGRDISATLDLEIVLRRIATCVRELLTREEVAIFLTGEDNTVLSAVAVSGAMEDLLQGMAIPRGEGILGSIVENAKAEIVNDVTLDPRARHIEGTEAEKKGEKMMAAPLFAQEQAIGLVVVWRGAEEPVFTTEELAFLDGIARQASIAIRNAQLFSETKKLATTDGLTGLLNRRTLAEKLEAEFVKTKRYQRPTSIIMADVDHFKVVNDTYGHDIGDAVLRDLSRIFAESVRHCDSIGRYGGEEFVILLPETALEGAHILAERVREAIEAHEIGLPDGRSFGVTASFGVSGVRPDDPNHEAVLKRADSALYQAKQDGRNRVSCAADGP